MLVSTPWRRIRHSWRRNPLVWVVMWWRTNLSRKVSLWIVEVVRRIRRSLEVMPWRKIILHESGREASEIMGRWRLVERRRLLVWGERSAEVRRTLHAERRLPLAPRWRLIWLVAPRWLLILAAPGWWGIILTTPGASVSRVAPVGVPLLVP